MPSRLCAEPACPEPATYRGRCAEHARERDKGITRAGYKIYRTAKWCHTRERVLSLQPLCPGLDGEPCGRTAEHVHHIVDIAEGGDPYSLENLQALCAVHHGKETRRRLNAQ